MDITDRIIKLRREGNTYRAQAAAFHKAAKERWGIDLHELEQMTDVERADWLRQQKAQYDPMPFNAFVRAAGCINYEREAFHAFELDAMGTTDMTEAEHWQMWHAFCQQQDAADERDTRNDVRYAGTW